MKSFKILIILLISISSSGSDSSWKFEIDQNGTCLGIRLKHTQLDIEYVSPFSKDTLESKYCRGLFAKGRSANFYFKKNHGLPINTLKNHITTFKDQRNISAYFFDVNSNVEQVLLKTSDTGEIPIVYSDYLSGNLGLNGISSISNDFIDNAVDWNSLLELNQKAKVVWDLMIKEKGELEARYQYFTSREFSRSRVENKKILEALEELKFELKLYLQSSEVRLTYGLSRLKNYHPLFTQLLVEGYVHYTLFTSQKEIREAFSNFEDLYSVELQIDEYLVEKGSYISNADKENKIELEALGQIRENSNIYSLLSMIFSEQKCEDFGLRPELTRTLIQANRPYGNTLVSLIVGHIRNINKLKCGTTDQLDLIKNSSPLYVIYLSSSKYFSILLKKIRGLY